MIEAFLKKTNRILVLAIMLVAIVFPLSTNVDSVFAVQKDNIISLPQVSNVTAITWEEGITIQWKKIPHATAYQIYRKVGKVGKYKQIGTSKTNLFTDKNLTIGKVYSYKIRGEKIVGNTIVKGPFNRDRFARSAVVCSALAWLGCNEENNSYKKIIDVYSDDTGEKVAPNASWSAIFVSAVAAKAKTTPSLVKGSNCPLIWNTYKTSINKKLHYKEGSKYTPKAGDIVFFDWDKNGKPNRMGIVASVSDGVVKTIEGNMGGVVGYRTFPVGYSFVLGYGLPNYDEGINIIFTGDSNKSIGCGELSALGIETQPEGYKDLGKEYDFVEQKIKDDQGGESVLDYDKMIYMIKKVQANARSENINYSKGQYYATFIYRLCCASGIEASMVTAEDKNGSIKTWVEADLDGKWYKINVLNTDNQIEHFLPEASDVD